MRMPDHLAAELRPWFETGLDVSTVELQSRGLLSFLFGIFGQWAVTWNGTVHVTFRAPFMVETKEVTSRLEGMDAKEALANALWLISHECLHVQQQRDMGWWRFLLAYVWEWLRHRGEAGNRFEGPAYALGDRVYQHFMERSQH